MGPLKIFYAPRCKKCKDAKGFFEKKKKNFELFDYFKEGLNKNNILEIIEKGSFSVREILRKGPEFKRFIQGKKLEDSEILDLMVKHPGLLQRPIIVDRTNAFIARDKESLESV
jgi:arsenate reductase